METNENMQALEPCSLATNGTQELEGLREQMGVLKRKLDKHEIVDDARLEKFRKWMVNRSKQFKITLIVAPIVIAIPFVILHYYTGVVSWPLIAVIILFVTASMYNHYRINSGNEHLFDGDIQSSARKLDEMKRQTKKHNRIFSIAGFILNIWLMAELLFTATSSKGHHGALSRDNGLYIAAVLFIAGIIGIAYGIYSNRESLREHREEIEMFKELFK